MERLPTSIATDIDLPLGTSLGQASSGEQWLNVHLGLATEGSSIMTMGSNPGRATSVL